MHSQQIDLLHQLDYKNTNHDDLLYVRGQLLFISQSSRSDISYKVSQIFQTRFKNFKYSDVKHLNHTVRYVQKTKSLKLQHGPPDSHPLNLCIFLNSGFNTNVDLTTQLGMVIFLFDDANHCHFLYWESSKSQLLIMSMLAAKF